MFATHNAANTVIFGAMAERKLLDQVSDLARLKHLSKRTEETYRNWIKRKDIHSCEKLVKW